MIKKLCYFLHNSPTCVLQNSPIHVMFYRRDHSCYFLQNSLLMLCSIEETTHVIFYRKVYSCSTEQSHLCSTEQPHSCHVLQKSPLMLFSTEKSTHVMFYRIVPLMFYRTAPIMFYTIVPLMFYRTVPLIHANERKSDPNNLQTYIMGLVQKSQHHSHSQYHYILLDIYCHVPSPPSPQL